MVAELAPRAIEVTRAGLIDAVEREIAEGVSPNLAFSRVFDEIDRQGGLEALARLHGANLVGSVWREWNGKNRPGNLSRTATGQRPPMLAAIGSDGRVSAGPPQPRIDAQLLRENSLLDGMYPILPGTWVRLRDMTAEQCEAMFEQYRAAAVTDEHNARYFKALAVGVGKAGAEKTVAEVYSEAQLMRLFNSCRPAGNTLA